MNNHEKYRKAFSNIQVIRPVVLEEKTMNSTTRRFNAFARPVLAMSIAAAVLGGSGIAYAADYGGIRTTITGRLSGQQHTFDVDETEDGYRFKDSKTGETALVAGGVVFDENGNEVRATAQELAEMNSRSVELNEQGQIMLYYQSASCDITDLFKDSSHADVQFEADGQTLYSSIDRRESSFEFSFQEAPEPGVEYVHLK